MFALAVSRASERVVLSAVANDDEQRSVFFSLLPAEHPADRLGDRSRRCRCAASPGGCDAPSPTRDRTARMPRARPARWPNWRGSGCRARVPTTGTGSSRSRRPVRCSRASSIPVSPSRMERLEESPLDWFLETIAGRRLGRRGRGRHDPALGDGDHGRSGGRQALDAPSSRAGASWSSSRRGWPSVSASWPAPSPRRSPTTSADFQRDGKTLVAAEGRFKLEYGELAGRRAARRRHAGPQIVVNGSIDRVERGPDGEVVIVDLKTGRPITSRGDDRRASAARGVPAGLRRGEVRRARSPSTASTRRAARSCSTCARAKTAGATATGIRRPWMPRALEAVRERIRQAAVLIAAAEFEGRSSWSSTAASARRPRLRLHRVRAVSSD